MTESYGELIAASCDEEGVRQEWRTTPRVVAAHSNRVAVGQRSGVVRLDVVKLGHSLPSAAVRVMLSPDEAAHLANLLLDRAAEARRAGADADG